MKFGLSNQQYSYLQDTVVTPLKSEGATVWIFGSRARGDHEKYSDVDIMVRCEGDISADVSNIQELLDDGNFPYKVDIVLSSNFAESYRESFDRDKVQI